MSLVAVALAALALDATAVDQTASAPMEAPPTVAAATATGKVPEERVTCRTQTVTGSRFGKKICESQEAAKLRRQETREALERAQTQRPLISP